MVFMAGWLAWAVLLFWLRNVTSHLEMTGAALLGWTAVLALSAVMALFWWGWFMAALYAMRRSSALALPARLGTLAGLAALWVLMEWIRTWIFTGFPWLPLSVSQWERPLLLQIASLTGGAGISFVLVAFNAGLAFYLHGLWFNRKARWWRRLSMEFYLALFFLFGAIAFGLYSSGAGVRGRIDGPELAFVQPNVGAFEKWDADLVRENLDVLTDLTTYAAYLDADLVLWPESPTPQPVKGSAGMERWVEGLSRELERPLLIGNIAVEQGDDGEVDDWYNAVLFVSPESGVELEDYYAKRHLVPFGEYVPFAGAIPFLRKVVPVPTDMSRGDSARPLDLRSADPSLGRVGVLICYEDVFPALARENVLAGADWHYVATNNAWFGEEAAGWQHAAHSVLRAVETRRPVVRCGNAGWSGWIDEFGHIRHVMLDDRNSIYFQGVESVRFSRNRWWAGRHSPYVKNGDWFVGASAGLVLLAAFLLKFSASRKEATAHPRRELFSGVKDPSRRKGSKG